MNLAILAQQTDAEPLLAAWNWLALVVLVVALLGCWLAPTTRGRLAALLLAILSGMVAVAGLFAAPRFRAGALELVQPLVASLRPLASNPFTWGIVLGAVALLLMLPRGSRRMRNVGAVIGIVAFAFFVAALPLRLAVGERVLFWALALLTIGSAAATISMRSPVYSAIWFALSLLGTAALYFYQGAQFLGVATLVVYAGAIVVTFLFVVMLAQPEGHDVYDRISWGWFPRLFAVITAAAFIVVLTMLLVRPPAQALRWKVAAALPELRDDAGQRLLRDDQLVAAHWRAVELPATRPDADPNARRPLTITLRGDLPAEHLDELTRRLPVELAEVDSEFQDVDVDLVFLGSRNDVLDEQHMAHLGSELFSRHLVSVEAAGTVLLAALVGAVAIVSHGQRRREDPRHEGRGRVSQNGNPRARHGEPGA